MDRQQAGDQDPTRIIDASEAPTVPPQPRGEDDVPTELTDRSRHGADIGEAPTIPLARGGEDDIPTDLLDRPAPGGDISEAPTRHIAATPPPPPSSKGDDPKAEHRELIGKALDGYRVEQLLGAGGMGAVYLAHQISLDRKVALKVLPARFSNRKDLLARFTREALAAAQISHHNVVQVFDVGESGGTHYISMEYVAGTSLAQMIRHEGRLRIDDAAAYTLQAARGLHHAHERGIIHRDIKPDNIMLNEHGVVKIADLGLAKMTTAREETPRPTAADAASAARDAASDPNLTRANVAMGTPAYMAPEQARNTATAGPQADQYSLGCTLYYLCAGKAPYSGTTAFELMSKHLKEPLTPLDVHISGVPPAFSRIVMRMLAKNPDERYPSMKELAADLESYLGIETGGGPYKPREQHLAEMEAAQKDYYNAPSLKKRRLVAAAFFVLMPILFVLAALTKSFAAIGAVFGLFALVPTICFIVNGMMAKTHLFRRVRSVFFGMGWRNWLKLSAGVAGTLAVLYLTGWIWSWLGVAAIAAALAVAHQVLVLRPLAAERSPAIKRMQEVLKELRVRGVPEEALQDFVARFSGEHWEEFFEEFFGYEAMLIARARTARTETIKARKRHGLWRDPLARWLDRIETARREARERKQLARAEKERLVAEGVTEEQAALEAEQEATRILEQGLVASVPNAEPVAKKRRLRLSAFALPAKILFGAVRLVAGLAILAAFAIPMVPAIADFVPAMLENFLDPQNNQGYYYIGYGGTIFGALAGLILLLTVPSRRTLAAIAAFIGAMTIVFAVPVASLNAAVTPLTAFYAGGALLLGGWGMMLLSKLTGAKY